MDRRDLLRGLGSAAALAMLPTEVRAAWTRVESGARPPNGFSAAQLAVVATVSDVILPRTDTPGALDVRVPAFIDALVAESWEPDDRASFTSGLDALTAHLGDAQGSRLTTLIDEIESRSDRRQEPARTWWRLKGLIVHGYFTSERVMREVLRVEVMPGSFEGAAPVTPVRARPGGGAAAHA
jgi:hypothetical protein